DDIARGAPTLAQISKHGRQCFALRYPHVVPNWIHPEVRKHFETVINELFILFFDCTAELNSPALRAEALSLIENITSRTSWGASYKIRTTIEKGLLELKETAPKDMAE
ncbi:MAG: hypothetical protein ACXVLQ_14255, partial [Bacteriovorax sp.]